MEMRRRRSTAAFWGFVLAVVLACPAAAVELYRSEKANINLDTTLSVGVGLRVAERDQTIVFGGNDPGVPKEEGSTDSFFTNSDDGNLNYDQFDVYSVNVKATMDLEAEYRIDKGILREVGAFVRATAFYDFIGNCAEGNFYELLVFRRSLISVKVRQLFSERG